MQSFKPSQYIKGWVEFYKLKFKVTPDVLIPRPETELLVDAVLKSIKHYELRIKGKVTVWDIGAGAGNIAISIAKNLGAHLKGGNVNIIGTDISAKALKIAKQNAKLHGVEDKIFFIKSNLLSQCIQIMRSHNLYTPDIIVTNLPYIPSARISYLDSSVKDFEPHIALDGGEDGFDLYRKLFTQIIEKGWQPDLLIGEIDYTHGELAVNEALKFFPDAKIEVKTDLAHKQRILTIDWVTPAK